MENNNKKVKILAITACCMVVVIAIILFIIAKLNNDDETEPSIVTNESGLSAPTNIVSEVTKIENNDNNISKDNGEGSDLDHNDSSADEISRMPQDTENIKENVTVILGDYKGIKVDYSPIIITDEDIDTELRYLKSENTEIVDMPDRPFKEGDMAVITYKGYVDNMLIDDLYVICLQVILGRGTMPEIIENEIIGRTKGEKFTADIDYPEDYSLEAVAGKTVHFEIEIVDGFIFDIPVINDEFIKKVTKYSTVGEYKTNTKAELQKEQDDIAYEAAMKELKEKVIGNCTFTGPIDDEIKKQYVIRLNSENAKYQEEYSMDAATYQELFNGIPAAQYGQMLLDQVTTEVKYNYVLDEIAKKENLAASNPDADIVKLHEIAAQIVTDSAVLQGEN